ISSRRDMGILRSAKHRLFYRLIGPLFDRVLTVSEEVSRFCVSEDQLDPTKVITVYSGIDVEKFRARRSSTSLERESGTARDAPVITAVGHIRRIKGFDVFIRAAALVRRDVPNAEFLIVGDAHEPEYALELHELARSLGLTDCVRFLGGTENVVSVL